MEREGQKDSRSRRLVDLSHAIESGMVTYRGLPGPVISDYLGREQSRTHYAEGTEFHIGRIDMVANTGTYLDSPFHRYAGGKDLSDLELAWLAGLNGLVVRVSGRKIGAQHFHGLDMAGKAVLVHTGWDKHWGTEQYFSGHPFLLEETAKFLRESGVALVGIDSLNIDSTDDGARPVHSILLGANIPIVEHLCGLAQVPDSGFTFFAVPPKIRQLGSFPVRAFAMLCGITPVD